MLKVYFVLRTNLCPPSVTGQCCERVTHRCCISAGSERPDLRRRLTFPFYYPTTRHYYCILVIAYLMTHTVSVTSLPNELVSTVRTVSYYFSYKSILIMQLFLNVNGLTNKFTIRHGTPPFILINRGSIVVYLSHSLVGGRLNNIPYSIAVSLFKLCK